MYEPPGTSGCLSCYCERIDRAVYAAYGWSYPLTADEVLEWLMELNLARSGIDS
jgi:hypothetical protein